jgi:hypothetical protein
VWPLGASAVALALVLVPGPLFLRAIGGVPLLLFLPGFALAAALIGFDGPAGETALVSVALSVAVTGLGGLVLALAHDFGRSGIIAIDATVALGAGSIASLRVRRRPHPPGSRTGIPTKILVVAGTALSIVIVVAAFRLDVPSARSAQRQTTVALSAVQAGHSLHIEVTAPGTASFSGTLELQGSAAVLETWTVPALPPGGRWAPSPSVSLPANAAPLQLVLSHDGAAVRVLDLTPPLVGSNAGPST